MESPELQSSAAPAGLPDHRQHNGIPGRKPLCSALASTLSVTRGGRRRSAPERSNAWTTISLSSLRVVTSGAGPVLRSIKPEHISESRKEE